MPTSLPQDLAEFDLPNRPVLPPLRLIQPVELDLTDLQRAHTLAQRVGDQLKALLSEAAPQLMNYRGAVELESEHASFFHHFWYHFFALRFQCTPCNATNTESVGEFKISADLTLELKDSEKQCSFFTGNGTLSSPLTLTVSVAMLMFWTGGVAGRPDTQEYPKVDLFHSALLATDAWRHLGTDTEKRHAALNGAMHAYYALFFKGKRGSEAQWEQTRPYVTNNGSSWYRYFQLYPDPAYQSRRPEAKELHEIHKAAYDTVLSVLEPK